MGVVLAVSSSGGHWSQLMLLRPAFERARVVYVSTVPGIGEAYGLADYHCVSDCNRDSGFGIFRTAWQCLKIFRRANPSTVISTGALPGLLMVIYARLCGRQTIWVDSIANSERMSMCGNAARWLAHKCFVQWPELTRLPGAQYAGSIL